MENNENLVAEVTENVENTTEQTQQEVKTYTQEEVNDIVGKAKARTRAKIEKENNRKYGQYSRYYPKSQSKIRNRRIFSEIHQNKRIYSR